MRAAIAYALTAAGDAKLITLQLEGRWLQIVAAPSPICRRSFSSEALDVSGDEAVAALRSISSPSASYSRSSLNRTLRDHSVLLTRVTCSLHTAYVAPGTGAFNGGYGVGVLLSLMY